ncbi:MAG: hypothetical protein DI590_16660 [Methylorubrum populi]|nr:MAG: hypothetical protein DI590_16660 [Methylorubrum populi]
MNPGPSADSRQAASAAARSPSRSTPVLSWMSLSWGESLATGRAAVVVPEASIHAATSSRPCSLRARTMARLCLDGVGTGMPCSYSTTRAHRSRRR